LALLQEIWLSRLCRFRPQSRYILGQVTKSCFQRMVRMPYGDPPPPGQPHVLDCLHITGAAITGQPSRGGTTPAATGVLTKMFHPKEFS